MLLPPVQKLVATIIFAPYGAKMQTSLVARSIKKTTHRVVFSFLENDIDLTKLVFEKDRAASVKYNHKVNLEQFLANR